MISANQVDRARARYADALYRLALLRDGDPGRAASAVIAAFTRLDWDATPLDEYFEARLVAALPAPRKRHDLLRLRSRPASIPMPVAFWQLPPQTRLAVSLRLLRGMATPRIAAVLARPLADVQSLLLDSINVLGNLPATATGDACRRCRLARLDDPSAERAHLLQCASCPDALAAFEQSERAIAERLRRAVGNITLPRSVDEALTVALQRGATATAPSIWRSPWIMRGAAVVVVLAVLAALLRPRAPLPILSGASQAAVGAEPRRLLAAARALHGAVPSAAGIVHRRWEIRLPQREGTLEADEWIDSLDPARHRMQLLEDGQVKEWQVGGDRGNLRYLSALMTYSCGPLPPALVSRTPTISSWKLGDHEQQAMRDARWRAGTWALGGHYLDLASSAESLRSLGISGEGENAALTLAAEGRTISGTLLLRLDPITHALREVRELRSNNGQMEDRIPWRLVSTETIDHATALKQGVLTAYPDAKAPATTSRITPIIDPICPLVEADFAANFPHVLASAGPVGLIGLPTLPAGVKQAVVIGQVLEAQSHYDLETVQIVYAGAGKRLVFAKHGGGADGETLQAGPWNVRIREPRPGIQIAALSRLPQRADMRNVPESNASVDVWAEGYTRDELLQLLATARPLHLIDWAQAPEQWYTRESVDAVMLDRWRRIITANAVQPGRTLLLRSTITTRQAPFFAELADPYHVPAASWPAERRSEALVEFDASGNARRSKLLTTGRESHVLNAAWSDGATEQYYQAWNDTIESRAGMNFPSTQWYGVAQLFLHRDWNWQTLPDGSMVAERLEAGYQRLQAYNPSWGPWTIDSWTFDLPRHQIAMRLTFSAGGRQRQVEQRAVPPEGWSGGALSSPVLLYREVIDQRWLASVPIDRWDWKPPPTARPFKWPAYTYPSIEATSAVTLARAAAITSFPLWKLPDSTSLTLLDRVDVARDPASDPSQYTLERIEHAVGVGLAVNNAYRTPNGQLNVLQGPAAPLRQILRHSMPLWTSSSRRVIGEGGRQIEVWVMEGEQSTTRWAIVEHEQSLLFLRHDGPRWELDVILNKIGKLEQVVAASPSPVSQ